MTLEFGFFFLFRSVLFFFPKGYIFVFDMIRPVSFILFLIKPSSNVFMLLFFQRFKIPLTFRHKMDETIKGSVVQRSLGICVKLTLNE